VWHLEYEHCARWFMFICFIYEGLHYWCFGLVTGGYGIICGMQGDGEFWLFSLCDPMHHPRTDSNPIELSNLDKDLVPSCILSWGTTGEGGHDDFWSGCGEERIKEGIPAGNISTPGPLLMGRLTSRLMTCWYIGDGFRVFFMYNLSRGLTVILITVWWLQKLGKYWQ